MLLQRKGEEERMEIKVMYNRRDEVMKRKEDMYLHTLELGIMATLVRKDVRKRRS